MSKTAIIVLNWNGSDDTIRCIESLKAQDLHPTIILIDNASTDDSVIRLTEYVSNLNNEIIFIKNTTNGGYSGGINVGMRYALDNNFEFIGVLNPDAVASKNWLSSLLEEFSKQEVGAVTGLLLSRDGSRIDSTGEIYSIWGLPSPRGRGQYALMAHKKATYIFGASGGSVLYRANMLRRIGLFDEKFFMYFEDIDLCFRAQLSGYKVRYTPKAVAYHETGSSSRKVSGLTVYMTFKNIPMLLWKNVPNGLLLTVLPRFCITYLLLLISAVLKGSGTPASKGLLVSFKNIPHVISERRKIQALKSVTNQYVSSIILHDIPVDQTGMRKFRKVFTGKS